MSIPHNTILNVELLCQQLSRKNYPLKVNKTDLFNIYKKQSIKLLVDIININESGRNGNFNRIVNGYRNSLV